MTGTAHRAAAWILAIPGGGWHATTPAVIKATSTYVAPLRAGGWRTDVATYRAGVWSLPDVLAAYDRLRQRVHGPICVWGASAGGNLALLLAERRQDIACVITEGAPTDLVDYPFEAAYDPGTGGRSVTGPRFLYDSFIVPELVGHLREFSPVHAARLRTRVLMGASTNDYLVPQQQMVEMRRAGPRLVRTMLLAGAPQTTATTNFTHANVTAGALAAWRRTQRAFLTAAR